MDDYEKKVIENTLNFKKTLDRISDKYAKVSERYEGIDVDFGNVKMRDMEQYFALSEMEISRIEAENPSSGREYSFRDGNKTNDSQIECQAEETNEIASNNSIMDGVSEMEQTQASMDPCDDTHLTEVSMQPEDQDEDLERTLSSHGSTLLELYPQMISQIGKACHRQHVSEAADHVRRRYRRMRRANGNAKKTADPAPAPRGDRHHHHSQSVHPPKTAAVDRAAAAFHSPARRHTERPGRAVDQVRRDQQRPVLVMDFRSPEPSEASMNQTFAVPKSSPHRSPLSGRPCRQSYSPAVRSPAQTLRFNRSNGPRVAGSSSVPNSPLRPQAALKTKWRNLEAYGGPPDAFARRPNPDSLEGFSREAKQARSPSLHKHLPVSPRRLYHQDGPSPSQLRVDSPDAFARRPNPDSLEGFSREAKQARSPSLHKHLPVSPRRLYHQDGPSPSRLRVDSPDAFARRPNPDSLEGFSREAKQARSPSLHKHLPVSPRRLYHQDGPSPSQLRVDSPDAFARRPNPDSLEGFSREAKQARSPSLHKHLPVSPRRLYHQDGPSPSRLRVDSPDAFARRPNPDSLEGFSREAKQARSPSLHKHLPVSPRRLYHQDGPSPSQLRVDSPDAFARRPNPDSLEGFSREAKQARSPSLHKHLPVSPRRLYHQDGPSPSQLRVDSPDAFARRPNSDSLEGFSREAQQIRYTPASPSSLHKHLPLSARRLYNQDCRSPSRLRVDSPDAFPRCPNSLEGFSREAQQTRYNPVSPSSLHKHLPVSPRRRLYHQDCSSPSRLRRDSTRSSPATGNHRFQRHHSFDSSLRQGEVTYCPATLEEEFAKLYRKFVCQGKCSLADRFPCRCRAGRPEPSRGSSSSSAFALSALALSPHRAVLRKRLRELDHDRSPPRSKRPREWTSAPWSLRHREENLRNLCMSRSTRVPLSSRRAEYPKENVWVPPEHPWCSADVSYNL